MARPRTVKAVEITPNGEYDSSVLKFTRALRAIVGEQKHIHLAAARLKPARLAELAVGRPRMTPLRWSDLDESQQRALESLVPFRGTDDLVWYGDACVVTCPEKDWQAEQDRKAAVLAGQQEAQWASIKGAHARDAQSAGVTADDSWRDLPAEAGVGTPPR